MINIKARTKWQAREQLADAEKALRARMASIVAAWLRGDELEPWFSINDDPIEIEDFSDWKTMIEVDAETWKTIPKEDRERIVQELQTEEDYDRLIEMRDAGMFLE